MLRRTLAPASLFLIGDMSIALAQTSPLPGPRPPAKTETAQPVTDPDLVKFRSAYTSGDGIAYVVINDEKSERIYRYGDASRLTAKKDTRGYMLFDLRIPARLHSAKARRQDRTHESCGGEGRRATFCGTGRQIRLELPQSAREVRHPKGKQP